EGGWGWGGESSGLGGTRPGRDPPVGQAASSNPGSRASDPDGSAEAIIGSMRSILVTPSAVSPSARVTPASIGPPDTNTAGMFSRSAAISMPGVILSQLEMHTTASAQWAFTMYSTESAIS